MRNFGFKLMVVATGIVAGSVTQAQAGSLDDLTSPGGVVFERAFSADFLKENPNQKVEAIRFEKLPKPEADGNQSEEVPGMEFSIQVKFRDAEKPYEAAGMCFAGEEGQIDCRIDCDGSGFQVKADDKESILLLNTEGFQLNGCSDENIQSRMMKSNPDYSAFRLEPAPKG